MGKLLLDTEPLIVIPELAVKIGLNESIILQQIHYWLEINKKSNNNFKDEYYWTFNTYEGWKEQFPFWSERTIQRTILSLEKKKLIIIGKYNKLKIDKTKWYRIDYEEVSKLECDNTICQNGTSRTTTWHVEDDNLAPPLPETNTETNTEINIICEEDKPLPKKRKKKVEYSQDTKDICAYLKDKIKQNGVTVFARDWHLKNYGTAQNLLNTDGVTKDDVMRAIDWGFNDKFWKSKLSNMQQFITCFSQYQLKNDKSKKEIDWGVF